MASYGFACHMPTRIGFNRPIKYTYNPDNMPVIQAKLIPPKNPLPQATLIYVRIGHMEFITISPGGLRSCKSRKKA
eukprot:5226551-Karenia_brevis.AAC.1